MNTSAMLDSFSKDVVYTKMLPPYTQTLFVELIRFTPGQPESVNGMSSSQRSLPPPSIPRSADPGPSSSSHHRHSHSHHTPLPLLTPPTPVYELARQPSSNGHHVPPPPPWSSQWHSITPTPTAPRRSEAPEQPHSAPLPISPHGGKKRKFADDSPTPPDIPHGHSGPSSSSASGSRSPKQARRHPQTPVPPPATVPARAMQQTLSPSLAMIVSPVDTEPSPRPTASVPYGSVLPPPPPPLQPPPHPSGSGPAPVRSYTPPLPPPPRSIKLVLPKK